MTKPRQGWRASSRRSATHTRSSRRTSPGGRTSLGLLTTCRVALGGLDVVVNNAGVHGQAPIEELAHSEWHRVVDSDLTAAYLVIQAALPLLSCGASVVNIGASVALRGQRGSAHYTAAKAALIGLTRSLCKELGPRGIRVNTSPPASSRPSPAPGCRRTCTPS